MIDAEKIKEAAKDMAHAIVWITTFLMGMTLTLSAVAYVVYALATLLS